MKTDHVVVGLCLTFRNILTHVDQMFSERARVTLWSGSAQSKTLTGVPEATYCISRDLTVFQ
jgi:hypothetical protein